jgi:hypothetical protein
MNADPQMRDDLRALRRGGAAVCLVLLALLVLVVVASR